MDDAMNAVGELSSNFGVGLIILINILVGKLTPKGESDYPPESKLLRAIFGEKSRNVRNTSLKVHHGTNGRVIDIQAATQTSGTLLKVDGSGLIDGVGLKLIGASLR